ncbi:MAG TPA: GH32 C-terminal domain-containing protein [Tetrasphaera sp.]|nr:GH32 C-terminal domain-containing protein [Tetrasphaera sp.]
MSRRRLRLPVVTGLVGAGTTLGLLATSAQALPSAVGDEPYRPAIHFTPARNWMNDPNGLVYYKGTYHLFFQHNPRGDRWGNMSWGHATSTDLVHWREQPLAIPQTLNAAGESVEDIFSGSVVVDKTNSSGFGTATNPPLIAIYTSAYTDKHPTLAGKQAQSLAYSTDGGMTWTKYAGNPVLNRDSANFRDPKVFRYSGPKGTYWVMAAVEAQEHRVLLYKSRDLKNWTYLSDFGPANAVGGQWECPDLFQLQIQGTTTRKWVMVVNINPGSVAGGSGGQYFVGNFDGERFVSESTVSADTLPPGTSFASFDDGTYGDWTVSNEPGNWANGPWGDAPATGTLPGQNPVSGFVGSGLVNGFLDHDWPVGTMRSPEFTVDAAYLNFLVGGGNHPHVAGTQLSNDPPAGSLLWDGFEFPDGTTLADTGWQATGDFATEPWRNPSTAGGDYYIGRKRINTWEGGPRGDDNLGSLTSPAFEITADHLSMLVGGGRRTDGSLEVQLLVGGQVVRSLTGPEGGALNWRSWDVADLRGQQAQLRVWDQAAGGWGHLTLDHVVMGDTPAIPRSDETAVNLVVDGKVVASATGANSEYLDWHSFDLRPYAGRTAYLEIVDNNRFGWGHILADEFRFGAQPAATRAESYDWLDWGRDYYAAVSWNDVPGGKRVMIGWMNNWDYANDIPTSPWRSAMSLPRHVWLAQTPKGPRIVSRVVPQAAALNLTGQAYAAPAQSVSGSRLLPKRGSVARIDAVLRPGTAKRFGLTVHAAADGSEKTVIGYDTTTGRLFVDRTDSGNVGFHPAFPSVEDAQVSLVGGKLTLSVYLDRSSVELFAQGGRTAITDQVFPSAGSNRIGMWAEGGAMRVESLKITPLKASMFTGQ